MTCGEASLKGSSLGMRSSQRWCESRSWSEKSSRTISRMRSPPSVFSGFTRSNLSCSFLSSRNACRQPSMRCRACCAVCSFAPKSKIRYDCAMPVCLSARTPQSQVLCRALAVLATLLAAGAAALAQAPQEKVRVERYDIEVSFQPEKGFLHARAAVGLRASQYLEAIEFELNPYLKILEVTDPQGRKLDFVRSGRLGSAKLLVRLAEPCGAEQGLTLTFVYEGALPAKPLDYITKDGILLRDESRWYPAVDLAAFTQNFIAVGVPSSWTAITSGQTTGSIGAGLAATYASRTSRPVSSRSLVAFPELSPPMRCAPEPVQKEGYSVIESLSACYMGKQAKEGARLAEAAHELLRLYSTSWGPLGSGGMLR